MKKDFCILLSACWYFCPSWHDILWIKLRLQPQNLCWSLGLDVRKHVFGVSDWVRPRPACSVAELAGILKFYMEQVRGAQWLCGRVLDCGSRCYGFEPHRRHCVVSWAMHFIHCFLLGQSRKTNPNMTEILLTGTYKIKNKQKHGASWTKILCRKQKSRDMWFPTMWQFDKCRLRRACAASF